MIEQVVLDRILGRVVHDNSGPLKTPCWLWTGWKGRGYACIERHGRRFRVHVIMYEHFVGPVPPSHQLHHRCERRNCVNPDHLRPLTPLEHTHIHTGPPARFAAMTHCARGHAYTPENTYLRTDGGRARPRRRCKQCTLLRLRAAHATARRAAGKYVHCTTTHCRKGHPYAPEMLAAGRKVCHTCQMLKQRAYRERQRNHAS